MKICKQFIVSALSNIYHCEFQPIEIPQLTTLYERERASRNIRFTLGEYFLHRAPASKVAEAAQERSHLFNQPSRKKEDIITTPVRIQVHICDLYFLCIRVFHH